MGLRQPSINCFVHLVIIGLDLIVFFTIVRAVGSRWPVRPIRALDQVGAPIMDPLIEAVSRAIPAPAASGSRIPEGIAAIAVLLVATLGRMGLEALL